MTLFEVNLGPYTLQLLIKLFYADIYTTIYYNNRGFIIAQIRSKFYRAINVISENPFLFVQGLWGRIKVHRYLPIKNNQICINGIYIDYHKEYHLYYQWLYYCRYDTAVRAVMKKFLYDGATFIDVGANIGHLSAIGMGLVGKAGQVHSFEPVPRYYELLKELIAANPDHQLIVNQCAVGEANGKDVISVSKTNIGLNSIIPDIVDNGDEQEHVDISIIKLADYIKENGLDKIDLIKIDAEGYDFFVLRGLASFFSASNQRPPIICEIMQEAFLLLGITIDEISQFMHQFGYRSYSLLNTKREIQLGEFTENGNILFLADQN